MNEKIDELIQELGAAVLMDSSYDDYDWDSISVVLSATEGRGMHGHVYLKNGDVVTECPSDVSILELAAQLRVSMHQLRPEDGVWVSILLQLLDDEGDIRINILFNYDDEEKWQENNTTAEELRWRG
jgi:hypothetical protein